MRKLALPLFLLFLSTFSASAVAEAVNIRFQWKHQFEFAGFYMAKQKGYYQAAGLDVSFLEYDEETDSLAELLKGETQFALFHGGIFMDVQRGAPVKLVSAYLERSPLVLATAPDIVEPGDLRSRRIMALPAEINGANMLQMLGHYGLTPADLELVSGSHELDPFVAGEVDAISIFLTNEPFVLRKRGVRFNLIDPVHYGTVRVYAANLVTSSAYAEAHPEKVRAFRDATEKGWRYALAHPEEAVDVILTRYNTQGKSREHLLFESEEIGRLMRTDGLSLGTVAADRIREIQQLNIELGFSSKFVEPEQLVFDFTPSGARMPLTEKERRFIRENPVVTFGVDASWEPHVITGQGGALDGFEVELFERLSRLTGLEFRLKTGAWNEVVQEATQRDIDGLVASSALPERSDDFLFSDPYTSIRSLLVIRTEDRSRIAGLEDLKGKRVGIQKGNALHRRLLERVDSAEGVPARDYVELLHLLVSGEVDAVIGDGIFLYKATRESLPLIQVAQYLPQETELVYSIRKDWPELRSLINKALAVLPADELVRLRRKWLLDLPSRESQPGLSLTDAEREYLAGRGPLAMCVDPDWAPYEWIDEQGRHRGISADFVALFEQRINKAMRLVPTRSWRESLRFIRDGQCEILPLAAATSSRSSWLSFTTPYISSPEVVATVAGERYIEDFSLVTNRRFGVPAGYSAHETLQKAFPGIELVEVEDITDGLKQVSDGRLFGVIGLAPPIVNGIRDTGLLDLKINGTTGTRRAMGVVVRKDDPVLLGIFQKAVDSVSEQERKRILSSWVNVKYQQGFDYSLFFRVLIPLILLVVAGFFWNRRLRAMNRALTLANEEAEKARRTKSQFLAAMSHELRTPLNSILGHAQLLNRETGLTENVHQATRAIGHSGRHLLNLINNVLEHSVLESGRFSLNPVPMLLRPLLDEVALQARPAFEKKGLAFSTELGVDFPVAVVIDGHRLRQVLTNLLDNAAKYTPSGQIVFRARSDGRQADGKIKLRFEVSDTGDGIAPEMLSKLFRPFERANRTEPGAGLGLAISHELVERMGGRLEADSQLGEGSLFRIHLAVAAADPSRIQAPTRALPVGFKGPRRRILVVDDVADNRQIVRELLTGIGFSVDEAKGGEAAVRQVRSTEYDLVLLDIRMPDMDGYGTLDVIRALKGNALPIIALSADSAGVEPRSLKAAGFDGYLEKPLDFAVLLAELEAQMGLVWQYADQENLAEPKRPHPVVDAEGAIRRLNGRTALYDRLARQFLERHESLKHPLCTAFEEGDSDALRHHAHALNGLAANIGADRLVLRCKDLEQSTEPASEEALHQTLDELDRVAEALSERFSQSPGG